MGKVKITWRDEDLLEFKKQCREHFSKIDTEILKKHFNLILNYSNERHKKDSEDYEGKGNKND